MPNLDGSVGTNAQNKPHDVAVIQAALGKIKGPDRKPFWLGPVDGNYQRHRKTLDQAIGFFQQSNRLRPSGKLNRLGSDISKLESALPASHRRMVGVVGTAVVRRETLAVPVRIEGAIRRTQTKPLPRAERKALAGLQTAIARAHNLCFEAGEVEVMPGGRFQVALVCPNSEWLDPRRNVFERGGRIPEALRRELERTLRGGADAWKPVPSSGDKPGLVLVTARAFSALKPGAKPDRDDLEAFGIVQAPSDKTARACLAGCLQLASSGEVLTPTGRKLFEALREALGVKDPQAAAGIAISAQRLLSDLSGANNRPDEKLLRFYEFSRPSKSMPAMVISEILNVLDGPRPFSTEVLGKTRRLCKFLKATDKGLSKQAEQRLQVLSGPVTEESWKYIRRPTMAEINAFAGPPMLFVADSDAIPSQEDLAATAGTITPDQLRRSMVELPSEVSNTPNPENIVLPEDDPDVFDRLLNCLTDHYGLDLAMAAIGSVAVILGLPLASKAKPGALGGTKNTSYARKILEYFSQGKKMEKRRGGPVFNPKAKKIIRLSGTLKWAGYFARFVPFLGWVFLAADAVIIAQCVHASSRRAMS